MTEGWRTDPVPRQSRNISLQVRLSDDSIVLARFVRSPDGADYIWRFPAEAAVESALTVVAWRPFRF